MRENAYVREIWLEGYEYVKEISGDLGLAVRKLVRDQIFRLDTLAIASSRLLDVIADIKSVLANSERFTDNAVEEARDLLPQFEESHRLLLKEVGSVEDDVGYEPPKQSIPLYMRPVEVSPPPVEPPVGLQPRVIIYTGPSRTGERREVFAGPLPPDLKNKIKSLEILGDFQVNTWWISFRLYTNGPIDFQTFISPCVVNVLSEFGSPRTYRAFNIMTGNEEDIRLSDWFGGTSEVVIVKNSDSSKLPPTFNGLGSMGMPLS
ncbi:hypothetical protein [Pseudoduganella umbonata]|uniref:Uncharacterized protein n=1 Tax=Pseudoduganella umbonata TaxID=864828 RepID=A0A4V1EEE9_9BURK|nr:hypothetical protein [Pseudoduganella umbonata]MBB3221852.1 hypothetical protein [Pseudoduganella umbonata]QCP14341.1 hypothetical protein FCL38_30935 [Pseudoduganella umbonata]